MVDVLLTLIQAASLNFPTNHVELLSPPSGRLGNDTDPAHALGDNELFPLRISEQTLQISNQCSLLYSERESFLANWQEWRRQSPRKKKKRKETNKQPGKTGLKIKAANRTPAGATICLLRKHFPYSKCHLLLLFFLIFLSIHPRFQNRFFFNSMSSAAQQHKILSALLLLLKSHPLEMSVRCFFDFNGEFHSSVQQYLIFLGGGGFLKTPWRRAAAPFTCSALLWPSGGGPRLPG